MAGIQIKLSEEDMEGIAERVVKKLNDTPKSDVVKAYTVTEVAKIINVTTSTVTKHIRLGLLKAKKTGKSYAITEQNLKNYLENEE